MSPLILKEREMETMPIEQVVHSDPERMGGVPVFVGTRVPFRTLFDYLAAGDSIEVFLDHFPSVTHAQAVAAIYHAEPLLVAHARAA